MTIYRMESHTWADKTLGGHTVCRRCGLILLRNPLTAWAVARGCNHEDHPDWSRVKIELVRQHQTRKG